MLKFTPIEPVYQYSVCIFELPAQLQEWARAWGNDCDEQLDYADGDYHVLLDFRAVLPDTTADEMVQAVLDGSVEEVKYPFAWQEVNDDFEDYAKYKRWMDVVRYIAQNLPPELVSQNKVALCIWH